MNKNALVSKRTRKQAFSEATTIRHSSFSTHFSLAFDSATI
jgi:hypothetical protein